MNTSQLNRDFGIDGQLEFIEGPGGLVHAHIRNRQAQAVVSTYAGQVLSFRPAGARHDVLFVSEAAYFQSGKAIKGGIPVCWPWFGPDPDDRDRGAHGFVRSRQWNVSSTDSMQDGQTQIVLAIDSDASTRAIWPHDFTLRIEITVGSSLETNLITENTGDAPFSITQALHSYFGVGDVTHASVEGLEGNSYIDKLEGSAEKTQQGTVVIDREIDRIYLGVERNLVIDDPVWKRRIVIAPTGSHSSIVWNPWIDKAVAMDDFGDQEYRDMLCVETANAGDDTVSLAAGELHCLGFRCSTEPRGL